MKKWVKWLIVIVIIAVVAVGAVFLLSKNSGSVTQEKLVTAKVKQGDMKINATGTGAISPVNTQVPDYDELQLVAQMDELDIPNIKKDQEVKVTVTALPDKTYTGKVKEIAEQGQVQNGVSSFSVIISLDKTDDLKAGMTADASILVNEKKDALYVPIEAVQKDSDDKYYVLVPEEKDNGKTKKVKKFVVTGLHNEDNIEITKGVKKGEKVILPTQETSTVPGAPS
ncbi:HlyD family secretion protein [Listeria monocytogenes]|uniref:efflux RND transporter periplasmic adaptor subunit n=1 Tax=Listeria monocytogenes TaxID=1639 RepID=UPI0003591159|nr:HlyD family secretion protein [Listeria monocytogenes]AGR07370.1 hemolysin D [Listeria monocytogenes]ASH60275.1 Secretion protein [Listeria monocytogenes serotype 1/2a str. 10-0933]ASH63071.1 Secretion protein [Listeria monocytogenes serotype 1/2a str. 10-0934]EAA0046255.1 HlyD family efflux transporter periplasmic adaptor subunit [Listeria monocytogenes]EAA0082463.1 HlyD family efflux transporter periplasmic adaptor subunit [Listeria monocytogenes]